MGKLDSKKAHKSGKVPLGESAKSSVANTEEKAKRKPPSCSACGQPGHCVSNCKMPKEPKKPKLDLADWDEEVLDMADELGMKVRVPKIKVVAFDDWV